MMKRVLCIIAFCLFSISAKAQLNATVVFEYNPGTEKQYVTLSGGLKKNIRNDVNIFGGIGFRGNTYKFYSKDYLKSDFVSFQRDNSFKSSDGTLNVYYLSFPAAVEVKINRFFRLEYSPSANLRFDSSKDIEKFLEGGKQSLKRMVFMSNLNAYAYLGGASVGLGVSVLHNSIINTKKEYHYVYMKQFHESVTNSWVVYMKMAFDFPIIKKKKIL